LPAVIARAAVIAVVFGCAACTATPAPAGSSLVAAPTAPRISGSVSPTPSTTTPETTLRSAGPGEFLNPVIDADFPDPFVLRDGDSYYGYATASGETNIQAARSDDLIHWTMLPDALPDLPSWSGLTTAFSDTAQRATWAPEVARIGERYVMYYTAPVVTKQFQGDAPQCIGRAVSDGPEGAFVDDNREPLVCRPEQGFTIDPSYFRDVDGRAYLLWRGGCCDLPSRIYIQRLTANGLDVSGQVMETGVQNDQTWEGNTAEAPTLLLHDGTYYLLYSGNSPFGYEYAVGYATSTNAHGPYTKAAKNPILVTDLPAVSPGHQSVLTDRDGDLWLTYHAWQDPLVGYEAGGHRAMWIDELVIENAVLSVIGPDAGPQNPP
jgi:beta-xylosidase